MPLSDVVSASGDYMAFGLSGSSTELRMIGADVIVVHYDSKPLAADYYIDNYAQVSPSD